MWLAHDFPQPSQIEKDFRMLGMISRLYLLYKTGGVDYSLTQEIYALYHSQLCDRSLQDLCTPLMIYLHKPDDFVTAFENPSLQDLGMSTLIWKWLRTSSSFLYHWLQETKDKEEFVLQFFLLIIALSSAKDFSCIEQGFWKWISSRGKDFAALFPHFICNFFYWKNYKNGSLDWEGCKKMFEEWLSLFPASLKKNAFYADIAKNLKEQLQRMEESPFHWLQGSNGWPTPTEHSHGGKWITETVEQLLFYLAHESGFVATCAAVENSAFFHNYIKQLFSLFASPLTLKTIEMIYQKLDELNLLPEQKDPNTKRLFHSLLLWKNRFLQATSFSIHYFDSKKGIKFSAQVPESLECAILHPEKVFVTLIAEKGNHYSAKLSLLLGKELTFTGLPNPQKELEEAFLNIN